MARLDRLGPGKDVALTASIIGRDFSYELIEAVAGVPAPALQAGLQRLVESDLLGQRGQLPHARYTFKHALIQDAAYQAVLRARRRELHRRIADVLAARFPELAETEPEVLAHHYTEAGAVAAALAHWRRAAERAVSRLAYVEALGHAARAKALVEALPEGRERDEWALAFLAIEGPSWMALEGWDSAAARGLYDEARRVAERLGRPTEVFRSIWGLWMGAHSSGQHARAHALYREMFELLADARDPEYVVQAHHAGGSQMVAEGWPRKALAHIEQLMASYRMDVHGNLALTYGAHDPGCCSLSMRALSHLMMGDVEQALEASAAALALSERLDHKPSIAHTQLMRAELCFMIDRADDAGRHLRTCIELSRRYSLAAYLNAADLKEGWVRAVRGEVDAGVRQAEAALAVMRSVPTRRFHLPIRIAIAGRARAAAGDSNGALALYDLALAAAVETGERWYEAEMLRFRAEALLATGDATAARRCLESAIAVARAQEARLWELRSAVALAPLLARQGQAAEGRRVLASVHDRFGGGADAPDLAAARALLSRLGP